MGLKPSAKKRCCFLIKDPENSPRKDKNLPYMIISEKSNIPAAANRVQVVPHPFAHQQQFERTIQNTKGIPKADSSQGWHQTRPYHYAHKSRKFRVSLFHKIGSLYPIEQSEVPLQKASKTAEEKLCRLGCQWSSIFFGGELGTSSVSLGCIIVLQGHFLN
jgi:hypothetical protein